MKSKVSGSQLSRRRFLRAAAGGTVLLGSVPLLTRYASAAEEIRLGALCELSGPASTIGSQQAIGIRMAVDEINKTGVLGGGPGIDGRPIRLILEDTESKVAAGLTKAKKLVEVDKVHALTGIIFSSISMAIQQYVNREAKIPFINSGSGNPAISEPPGCGKYSFVAAPNSRLVALAAGYAAKKHGSRWAFIADDYAWGRLSVQLMKDAINLDGKVDVVGEEYASFGTTNYAPYITKATAAKPDVIGIATFGAGYAPVLLQLHQMGVKAHRHHVFWSSVDANAAGDACLGMTTGETYLFPNSNVPRAMEFAKAYNAIHGTWPDPAAARGYDGVMLLAEAIRKAKGTNPDPIVKVLETTDFKSPISGNVRFRDCDHMVATPVYVLEAKHSPSYKYYGAYVETISNPNALLVPCGKTGCEPLMKL